MSIDREVNARVEAYRGNPQALQNKYAMTKELVDLLALQRIKKGMDQQRNNIAMAMQTNPATIKQQREKEVFARTAEDVAQQVGGTLQNTQRRQQQGLQRLAQRAAPQRGLGALMPQQGQRPQKRMMAATGGIVGFQTGNLVGSPTSLADLPDKGVTPEQLKEVARAQIRQLLEGGVSPEVIKREVPPNYIELVDEVAKMVPVDLSAPDLTRQVTVDDMQDMVDENKQVLSSLGISSLSQTPPQTTQQQDTNVDTKGFPAVTNKDGCN